MGIDPSGMNYSVGQMVSGLAIGGLLTALIGTYIYTSRMNAENAPRGRDTSPIAPDANATATLRHQAGRKRTVVVLYSGEESKLLEEWARQLQQFDPQNTDDVIVAREKEGKVSI